MSVGVWVQAARPRTLLAAVAPVTMGGALAWADGRFAPLPAAAALVGALLIQIGTNLANDYYDFRRGGDADDRVGPERVTQSGRVPPERVLRGAAVAFGLALLVGVYLVAVGGWPILVIGVLSLVFGWAYTGGPWPLAYHGLGDPFVLLFFGPVAVAGTYWVQALTLPPGPVVAGVGVGALNTAVLVANNLRDLESDRRAGKRTLAVAWGRGFGRAEYVLAFLVAALVPWVGTIWLGWPALVLTSWIALVVGIPTLRRVLVRERAEDLMPALPATARVVGLYGLLFSVGVALGG